MSDRNLLFQIIDETDSECEISDPDTIYRIADAILAANFTSVPEVAEWIAYADKLERALEFACGQSKDDLMKMHAEQGLRLRVVRPVAPRS